MIKLDYSVATMEKYFADVGYIKVQNVIPMDEVRGIRGEVERIFRQAKKLPEGLVWFSPSTTGGYVIQRISRINKYSDIIQKLGEADPRLHQIASELLKSANVRFADGSEGSDGSVLVIKEFSNASEHRQLRWHRDAKFTQQLLINPFINLGIYLDDCPLGSGELIVLPRSHRLNNFDLVLEETTVRHPGEVGLEARAGDIVIHSSELWHCSRAHVYPGKQRRVLYFNYYTPQ
jgi:phytanoyl-CoA hydroxylase